MDVSGLLRYLRLYLALARYGLTRELAFRGQPLIAGYEADQLPPAGAGQLLAPWPNRVDGGRYVFGGTEYQLALTEPARGNAIHGLTRWAAWTAVQQDASAVRLRSAPHGQQGYPFGLEIEAEYRLDAGTGLQVTVAARNRGSRAAPYGTGSHPYLTVRTSSVDAPRRISRYIERSAISRGRTRTRQ